MIESAISRAVNVAMRGTRLARRGRQGKPKRYTQADGRIERHVRVSGTAAVSLLAGSYSGHFDFSLASVQWADIVAMYDQYKIDKVEFHLIPVYDPGQSGIANNTDVVVYAACEPSGELTTPTPLQVGAFSNCKVQPLLAGKEFIYTFKPKALNNLTGGNFALSNDWLICSNQGVTVPHKRLLLHIASNNLSSTQAYQFYSKIYFSTKNVK